MRYGKLQVSATGPWGILGVITLAVVLGVGLLITSYYGLTHVKFVP